MPPLSNLTRFSVVSDHWESRQVPHSESRTLPWTSSGHVTTRSMSLQHLRAPIMMLTFATKKLLTDAKGGCSFLLLSAQF